MIDFKIKFYLTTALVSLGISLQAQKHVCNYSSTNKSFNLYNIVNTISNSDDDIKTIVEKITDQYGGFPNFVLQRVEGFGNCAAMTDDDGIRYILYDRDFLQYHAKVSQTNYLAVVFILAHEIGHHVNGHNRIMLSDEDKRNSELEADQFAGFIMNRLGATKEDMLKILDLTSFDLFSYSDTHPAKMERIEAAIKGFEQAGNNFYVGTKQDIVNSAVLVANQISVSIMKNTNEQVNNSPSIVNPYSITGKAYKQIEKFSSPSNWFVAFVSNTFLTKDGCILYKYWDEEFTYERAPEQIRQNQLGATFMLNNYGKAYTSFDSRGEYAFMFVVYSTSKGVLRRNKNIFKVKTKVTNTSESVFPENVWTNSDRNKLLFLVENKDSFYKYKTVYFDLRGYQDVYNCLPEDQKSKYLNPDRLIKIISSSELE
jgi:hypothetical protein